MIQIEQVKWEEKQEKLRDIRREVFINEQKVPEEDEWDDHELEAIHFLAIDVRNGEAAGTARLLHNGKITRMAVRKQYRGKGVGSQLLTAALACAQQMKLSPYLDAQMDASDFYRRFGFKAQGQPFWDAGILHIRMTRVDPESAL